MELNNLYVIIGLTVAAVSMLSVMFYRLAKLQHQARYDQEKLRANLEMMRRAFEEKIYAGNERLTSDMARWQDVNHLLLEVLRKTGGEKAALGASQKPQSSFLSRIGVSDSDFKMDSKKVFVLTPFHDRFNRTYEIINDVCNKVGLKCLRGDETFIQGAILNHILKELVSAAIVIANVDGRNANVYYELGIAHALDKDVILISSNLDDVPFDIKSQRLIIWKNAEDLKQELTLALTRLLVDRKQETVT